MIIGIDVWRAFLDDKTGTETYSYELLKALLSLKKSRQHQFRLYFKKIDHHLVIPDWIKAENVVIKEINWPRLWTQGGLAIECLIKPPDVLFIPAHTLPLIRRPGLPTVVTIHGLEYQYLPEYYQFPQKLYLNKSTEMAVKCADRIIAVSQWTKKQLIGQLGAEAGKIKVIHEGVGERFVKMQPRRIKGINKQWLRQIKTKYQLGKRYILFVGTIQPRKNLVRLIKAFAEIKEKNIDLIIAGKKGWMYQEIFKAPSRFKVAKRVKFIGRVADADLPAVYAGAEIFVWPSLMEGFGLPVLEAMTMGIPVITSNRGALPEVAGEAALLIEPEQTADLTKAIDLLLDSQDLRQGLREKGYRQVKKFSWEKAAERTLTPTPQTSWFDNIPWLKSPSAQRFFIYTITTSIFLTAGITAYLYFNRSEELASPSIQQLDIAPEIEIALPRVASFLDGQITIGTNTGSLTFIDDQGNLYVKNAILAEDSLNTTTLNLLPTEKPDSQIGRQYVDKDTGNLMYFDGIEWVSINQSTSSASLSLQDIYDIGDTTVIAEDQNIDITLGNTYATTSATSLKITLAGQQSRFVVLGGANQEILAIDDDDTYPVTINQPVKITGNIYAPKFIDTYSNTYFLDPSATDLGLSIAGNATISATLKFSQYGEYLTNAVDGYLISSGGLGVAGGTTYGFDPDGDLKAREVETSSLTATGTFKAKNNVELGDDDDTITVSGTTISLTSNSSGNDITLTSADQIILQSSSDTNNYLYLTTSSDNTNIFFSGYTANDPGLRLNTSSNELEYRDENESTWTSLDSITGTWTDGGDYLYPNNYESLRIYETAGSDYLQIAHDGTDANITTSGTTDINFDVNLSVSGNVSVTDGSFIDDGTTLNVPDYVFEDGYQLLSPISLSEFISNYHHLPNVPSRSEIQSQGMNLSQIILNILEKTEENVLYILDLYQQVDQILSPTVETEHLATRFISPLTDDGQINITGPVIIQGSEIQEGSEPTLTVKGSASISGRLDVEEVVAKRIITDELIASKIKASTIEGLRDKIEGLVDKYREETATGSAIFEGSESSTGSELPFAALQAAESSEPYTSTNSAYLDIESINADFGFFSDYLAVMGTASITDLKVNNTLAIGGNLVFTSTSISSLDNQLYLQPSGLGAINLLAGLVVLDESGMVTINGDLSIVGDLAVKNASISGSLIASQIKAPINEDLKINIASQSAISIYRNIEGSEPSQVASIDASGSASFSRLNLRSAGNTIIPAGENHVMVPSSVLSENSQVIITFGSSYSPATKYWVVKNPVEEQFIIYVNYPVSYNTTIDWLIIN